MQNSRAPAIVFSTLLTLGFILGACSLTKSGDQTVTPDANSSSSSEATGDTMLTPNVSYAGLIEEMGSSIYMQGSHKITLDDGQIVVLESSDENLSLNRYVGTRVEVSGAVRPTIEGGGTIMSVSEVTTLEPASSSDASESSSEIMVSSSSSETSSSAPTKKMCGGISGFQCESGEVCVDDPDDSCDPQNGGADCSGMCITVLSSSSFPSATSTKPVSSASSTPSQIPPTSSSTSSSIASSSTNAALEEQIVLMAKQNYDDASLWTQSYCTSHIAFCIPVHKNWYFKSFGATTSNAWHVEFGIESIDNLGDGTIVLNLVSGTSADMSANSDEVKAQGSDVIGYKDWRDDSHFEIIADERLRSAIEYMIKNISPYEIAQ